MYFYKQINSIPYLGKTETPRDIDIPEYFLRKITKPIHGTNRTITCDNWFTSIPLIQNMLQPPYNTTITGTIGKNKREILLEMKVASKNPPETKFCFTDNMSLLSYTPKKNKIVLAVSSYLKDTIEITDGKPNVILHYNETKGGIDNFDLLCHNYNTSRATRRWPMRYFFGILDQAMVNARILDTIMKRNLKQKSRKAKECLEQVIYSLVQPYLLHRYELALCVKM